MRHFCQVFLTGLPALVVILVLALTQCARAQQASFYGPNGSFAGSSTTIGNTTSYYGPNGQFQGTSTNQGNTTTLYDRNGFYQGSVTRMPSPSANPFARR